MIPRPIRTCATRVSPWCTLPLTAHRLPLTPECGDFIEHISTKRKRAREGRRDRVEHVERAAVAFQLEIRKPAGRDSEFYHTLESTIDKVQDLQSSAEQQVSDVLQGKGKDLHAALIAVEKADLSFQLMMQVRNKIVQAYQEISRMPF